jgi:XisI protein
MDTLDNYRRIIKEVLVPYTQIPYSHAAIECKAVFDRENDSYLLITLGWDGVRRIHG